MACRTAVVVFGILVTLEPTEGLLAGLRGTPSAPAKHNFNQDCALQGKGSLVEIKRVRLPGSGTDQSKITPYAAAYKDGFQLVDCVKDYLFTHGDKFGNNKLSYKREQVSDVSIVHYTEHVASMDRKAMTHQVCFEFCRTIQNMTFFSLHNGRNCYCSPFFQAEASDSSMCDAPCDGNPATQCGGKSKSSVFAMHNCHVDNAAVLEGMRNKFTGKPEFLKTKVADSEKLIKVMTATSVKCHQTFSADGNPGAAGLCQQAKVQVSKLQQAMDKANKANDALETLFTDFAAISEDEKTAHGRTLKQEEEIRKAEKLMEAAKDATDVWFELLEASTTPFDVDKLQGAKDQYFPAMYFVDKAFATASSTCTGVTVGRALGNATKDRCARECDAAVTDCVGYQFFGDDAGNTAAPQATEVGLCFLMSKLETVTYYKAECAHPTRCYAKLSRFEGTTLKPDPTGKCSLCLKEAVHADRCFEAMSDEVTMPEEETQPGRTDEEQEVAPQGMKEDGKCATATNPEDKKCCGDLQCTVQKGRMYSKCTPQFDISSKCTVWGVKCADDSVCCGDMVCYAEENGPRCRLKKSDPCSEFFTGK